MKSVVQIQRQCKVKDVRTLTAASGLPTEEIESTVALIQGLIPLGLQAVGNANGIREHATNVIAPGKAFQPDAGSNSEIRSVYPL